ncbi:LAME_0A05424g1_1 [Lachancea meyersii CBS 8951]|uniref:LAME_0A05424g1_1 n=1 Tax=Lachancea meyersii CBS 8951 TaxID=1266667 RepID=A0A1G4IPN4_9SACH|nr:LAME_0A05424g1_1 [Lachancea meyersii CBS 8951]
MFRKRPKIRPGNKTKAAESADDVATLKSQRRNKTTIENYEDDEELDERLDLKPRERNKRTFRVLDTVEMPVIPAEVTKKHDIPFSTVRKPQIMNLENMSDEEDTHKNSETVGAGWEAIPSAAEIELIRRKRAILQQKTDSTGTGFYASGGKIPLEHRESEYVKLLNRDDKQDLLEVIGDGRKVETDNQSAVPNEFLPSAYEDGRLALGESELKRDEVDRKRAILSAMSEAQDEQWETQQINKTENKSTMCTLPVLQQDDVKLENVISDLQTLLLQARNKKEVLIAQKVPLEAEIHELLQQQQNLISRLTDFASE